MAGKLSDAENEQLFHEIKAMMADGEADEDQQPLSSDEEGYMEGLMEGSTARPVASARAHRTAPPSSEVPRKESVAAAGGQGFQERMQAAFGGLSSVLAASRPVAGWGGPAFDGQCRGHYPKEDYLRSPLRALVR